jgi:pimeloyl-ACP methyl ester carboxylesterase
VALVVVDGFNGALTDAAIVNVAATFSNLADVIAIELRGHGESGGRSTMGGQEILEVLSAVNWARGLGYGRVVTVGFSMGGAIVLRHAGILGGVDAVVAVSAPAVWRYRGTPVMRRLHFAVENKYARTALRYGLGTDVARPPWPNRWPMSPWEAAATLADTPVLVVHGRQDTFLPIAHALMIHKHAIQAQQGRQSNTIYGDPDGAAANQISADLWIEDAFGHAEANASPELLHRIAQWAVVSAV